MSDYRSLLVVRRDNIGDLVCTTPLLAALRQRYPRAWIGALVNSYNAPVLERNPDLDEVIVYRKLKHVDPGRSKLVALGGRIASLWRLRRMKLDCVVLAAPGFVPRTLTLARALAPRAIAGFSDGSRAAEAIDLPVALASVQGRHEVEQVFSLARMLDFEGEIPPLRMIPDPAAVGQANAALQRRGLGKRRPLIGVHVSARRASQRWPADRYAELIPQLHGNCGGEAMLLWSPGTADHPQHPGDDAKAAAIVQTVGARAPLLAYRTERLSELIGALSLCDAVVCSDGGAMHLAAALGKPIVCLFGDSPASRWRPWGVPHRVLQAAGRHVDGVSVQEVAHAFGELVKGTNGGQP